MVQRVKLAKAIFSNTPVLLLDEPCTNLDAEGYQLYHDLIADYATAKTIIVSSNDAAEMDFCKKRIAIIAITDTIITLVIIFFTFIIKISIF